MQEHIAKVKSALPLLYRFATGQLLLQFFNMLNGFFLLRWLTIEQQALFSIAFSVQTLLTSLSDMGFSSSIVALVSNGYNDRTVIGKYVSSAKRLRNSFFLIGILVCVLLYPVLMKKQAWNGYLFWVNMLPVIAASYWQANASIYSAPLMIHKKISELYLPQIISSALRLIANFILFLSGIISSFTTLTINALVLFFNSVAFKKRAVDHFVQEENDESQREARRQMLKYLAPLIPGLLFNSIYGQLQVFIIAFFGKSNNIAEVAALGRLAQLFLLLSAFNSVMVAPFIAKSSSASLAKKYLAILAGGVIIAFILVLSSIIVPGFYLFILGEKYHHLQNELLLIISTASINFIGSILWVMNSSRKWLFWWGSWTYIIGTLTCQVIGIWLFDVSSTHGVLLLAFLTSIFLILLHSLTAWYGFRKKQEPSSVPL